MQKNPNQVGLMTQLRLRQLPLNLQINGSLVPQPPHLLSMGTRNHFPPTNHRLYYSNILTPILSAPNEEKAPFHSAISILFYHPMKTSPLQPRQNQKPRIRLKQKPILKQSLALKSRLPTKSTMLILILNQARFQTQIEMTDSEALTLIQILKLEILDLVLGPAALAILRMEDKLMMNQKISKMLLLRLLVKPSRVLNSALVQ
jgi:hypothetical protein